MANYNERLKIIPDDILRALKEFLDDDKNFEILKSQLSDTGVMIEKNDFQISIKSVDELKELCEILNKKFPMVVHV
jgi:hypothetical protein